MIDQALPLQPEAGRDVAKLSPILSSYDVMICPTLAQPSVKWDHDEFSTSFTINGKRTQAYVGWVMTHGFNLVSQCPVMSVPTGLPPAAFPTGMQIVARPYDDMRVFATPPHSRR